MFVPQTWQPVSEVLMMSDLRIWMLEIMSVSRVIDQVTACARPVGVESYRRTMVCDLFFVNATHCFHEVQSWPGPCCEGARE